MKNKIILIQEEFDIKMQNLLKSFHQPWAMKKKAQTQVRALEYWNNIGKENELKGVADYSHLINRKCKEYGVRRCLI